MSKLLVTVSFAGLLLAGAPMLTHPVAAQPQSQQQSQATKKVAGKIMSIGNDGHSFELEVNQGGAKQSMQFVLDKNAKVQGNVRVGTSVTVEYAIEEGQNTALTVIAES